MCMSHCYCEYTPKWECSHSTTKTWQHESLSCPKAYQRPIIGHGPVLLPCFISKLKPSSTGLKSGTNFHSCGLCPCNLLARRNHFNLGTVLRLCLASELKEPKSMGLEPRTFFIFGVLTFLKSFLVTRNKHSGFRANWFSIFELQVNLQTNKQKTHNLSYTTLQ